MPPRRSQTRYGKSRWIERNTKDEKREARVAKQPKRAKASASKKSSGGAANAALRAVIDDLVAGNRILYNEGVVDGFGHLSARDPRDPNRFLLSRARAPGLVTAADIMVFGTDGEPIKDDGRPIYSERFIHSEIYNARPDVNSVVHTHSPTVVPFSVTNEPLLPIRHGFLYPEVPVFDTRDAAGWTDLLISNRELGRALAEKLGNNSVVLLRGHGNAVVGPDVRATVYRAVYTEANAKLVLQAKMLGGPIKYLAPEEAAIMNERRASVRPGHGSDRIWELLKSEAMGSSGKRGR
jgi:ribulose-5-phosphate 4-epimerase/fuculose-1-phosphate aldolase